MSRYKAPTAQQPEPEPTAPSITSGKKQPFKPVAQLGAAVGYAPTYEPITQAPQRLVSASAALQKRGKSRFGFTMPKPLLYMQLDANYEHVLAWARKEYKGKDAIRHIRYFADPRGDIKASNLREWERFVRDFDYGCSNFRSVLVDTASELLDVRKLADWGRLTQIPAMNYGSFYADMRWFVKRALDSNANVHFIHRLKPLYINDSWNGEYQLEGWRGIMFESQTYIEHQRSDDGVFTTSVVECAHALQIGTVLSSKDDENDFTTLAMRIYPDSTEKEWA